MSLVLIIGGAVLELWGLGIAFGEVRDLREIGSRFEAGRRAERTATAKENLRRIRLSEGGGMSPAPRVGSDAATRVVEHLLSAESRSRQRLAAALVVGGLVLTTTGSIASLWATPS